MSERGSEGGEGRNNNETGNTLQTCKRNLAKGLLWQSDQHYSTHVHEGSKYSGLTAWQGSRNLEARTGR